MKEEVVCPKCHSNQIKAHQKGMNSTRAVLFGVENAMLGSNEMVITCLLCATTFKAGEGTIKRTDDDGNETFDDSVANAKKEADKDKGQTTAIVFFIIAIIIIGSICMYLSSL